MARQIGNSVNANHGSLWSERWAGTNAIGTSIVLKRPVQIFSSEHFAYNCHDWVCSSAPIFDPLTGELEGVVNLSTTSDSYHALSMLKTITIANQIERMMYQHYYEAREMLYNLYIEALSKWKNELVLLCDRNGKIIKANRDAHLYEIASFMVHTAKNHEQIPPSHEWETEVILQERPHQAKIKKIYWYERFIGFLAILEKKERSPSSMTNHRHVAKYSFQHLIGQSERFQKAIHIAKVAAESDSNVLITGESGTGKELFASAIHQASRRSEHPFVALNCAAIPKDLMPSELFGYVAGAFTGANPKGSMGKFELANKGTLFLDELGDMPLELQVQLLRVIQEQEIVRIGDTKKISIDVRIIAATNKNLPQEIAQGNFREDLFYRLNVMPIELPSLRQRSEDIPSLAEHFIEKLTLKNDHGPYAISDEAMEAFIQYDWPGNIRELENVIEHAMNFAGGGVITLQHLPEHLLRRQKQKRLSLPSAQNPVVQAELDWILSALKRSHMNVTKAAKELQMSRSTLYRKLKKLGYDIKNVN